MSTAIDSRLMSTFYSLETLRQEFFEIVNQDVPDIDRALDCTILLTHAIEQFNQFIGLTKRDAASLVPDPKDEVIVGKARITHRIVANKRLDKDAWAEAVGESISLAQTEISYLEAKKTLDLAQAPFKLPSSWIEIKEAKS